MSSRSVTFVFLALVAIAAIVGGFVARGPIERTFVLRAVRSATGARVDAADAKRESGGWFALEDVRAETNDGAVTLHARGMRIRSRAGAVAVELDRPAIVVDTDRARPGTLAGLHLGTGTGSLRVHDGTLALTREGTAAPLRATLGGTLALVRRTLTYDVALALVDGAERYPATGRRTPADGGEWHVAALPLATLAAWLAPGGPVRPTAGTLTDLALDLTPPWHASAHLAGAVATVGDAKLTGLHGALVAESGSVGTSELVGSVDGVPLRIRGEARDLVPQPAWLRDGSRDLVSLARLVRTVAREPKLTSVALEETAPGLAFAQYGITADHGPVAISLLAIEPGEPSLRFDTAIAEDHVISGGERTSALGVRTGAVAGVNGDYFDIGRTYQPQGLLMRAGELVRGPTDRAALVIDDRNHATYAEFKLHGVVRTSRGTMNITELNDWPPGNVCVITPAFGKTLPASPDRTFVDLRPLGDGKHFKVTRVAPMLAELPVRFGIAIGPLVKTPLPQVGETIEMTYGLTPNVPHAVAGIGGGPILLREGRWYDDPHAPAPDERDYRWPVIAMATKADGGLMLVGVDGRHPERSVGMTRPEFGALLQRLGAIDAMALDSGGSVTMVARTPGDANVSLHNVPSDNSAERWISDALFLYSKAPVPKLLVPESATTPVPEARPSP